MTQLINDGQHYGDENLAEPGALFDPEVHDPISIDEMSAYKAFLMGLPQSCTAIPGSPSRGQSPTAGARGTRYKRRAKRGFPPFGFATPWAIHLRVPDERFFGRDHSRP